MSEGDGAPGAGGSRRDERTLTAAGRRWRVLEAWRSRSGHGLLYFLPLAEGEGAPRDGARGTAAGGGTDPVADDRLDRRAPLAPGERLEGLEEGELERRLAVATGLTVTERRFRAPDGRHWLAQGVGPVWAGEGVAGGATGMLFTSLEGRPERLRTTDGGAVVGGGASVGTGPDAEREGLVEAWRRAREVAT